MQVTFFIPQKNYSDFLEGKSTIAYDEANRPKSMGSVYLQVTADVQEVEITPNPENFVVSIRKSNI